MQWPAVWHRPVLGWFILLHTVGVAGLLLPQVSPWFVYLTPWMITLTFLISLAFQENRSIRNYLLLGFCGILGFLAEVAGVQRGWFFGNYAYGDVLGYKLWGVPILLLINWMWVLYGAQNLLLTLKVPRNHLPWFTACLLVLYDVLLERFAVRYGLWSWAGGSVPLQNYAGWFFVSLLLASLWRPSFENKMGGRLFLIQIFFFASLALLNLLLK